MIIIQNEFVNCPKILKECFFNVRSIGSSSRSVMADVSFVAISVSTFDKCPTFPGPDNRRTLVHIVLAAGHERLEEACLSAMAEIW